MPLANASMAELLRILYEVLEVFILVVHNNQRRASRATTKTTINAYSTTITNKGFKHNNMRYAVDNVDNACNGSVESKFRLENWAKHWKMKCSQWEITLPAAQWFFQWGTYWHRFFQSRRLHRARISLWIWLDTLTNLGKYFQMITTINKRRTACSSLCSMKFLRKLSLKFRLQANSTHQPVDPFWQDGGRSALRK